MMSTITYGGMSMDIMSHNIYDDNLIKNILILNWYQVSMISINKSKRYQLSRHFDEYQVIMIVNIVKSSPYNVEYKCILLERSPPFSNVHKGAHKVVITHMTIKYFTRRHHKFSYMVLSWRHTHDIHHESYQRVDLLWLNP